MSVMNVAQLQEMMAQTKGAAFDSTNMIREFKNSPHMLSEITNLRAIRLLYASDPSLQMRAFECAPFLAQHFQSIFVRIVKGELDLDILERAVLILKDIEEEKFNQEEGAKRFSAMMLELYTQGMAKKDAMEAAESTPSFPKTTKKEREITWKDWKKQYY